eukprot:5070847-Prymnesium_polylepis.3
MDPGRSQPDAVDGIGAEHACCVVNASTWLVARSARILGRSRRTLHQVPTCPASGGARDEHHTPQGRAHSTFSSSRLFSAGGPCSRERSPVPRPGRVTSCASISSCPLRRFSRRFSKLLALRRTVVAAGGDLPHIGPPVARVARVPPREDLANTKRAEQSDGQPVRVAARVGIDEEMERPLHPMIREHGAIAVAVVDRVEADASQVGEATFRRWQIERVERVVRHKRLDVHVAGNRGLAEAAAQPSRQPGDERHHGARRALAPLRRALQVDLRHVDARNQVLEVVALASRAVGIPAKREGCVHARVVARLRRLLHSERLPSSAVNMRAADGRVAPGHAGGGRHVLRRLDDRAVDRREVG